MINDSATSAMSRSRSFSNSWTGSRPQPPRVATVKPVSKSLSEDDLLKASDNQDASLTSPTRVFTRLNVNDLSMLKKDNIIGELEKCLEELESEHGYAQRLGDVYEKVESERNQLLDELDMAFQDLQLYMQKQKQVEDEKSTIETDREELTQENDELQKENEYLKAVLSNRHEISNNRLQEENHQYAERIKELEQKNGQHLDEINELYEERQTLITSLLHLQSAEVEDVIRKTSRSSSVCSRESLEDLDTASNVRTMISQIKDGDVDKDAYIKTLKELQSENEELKEAFKRIRKERDTAEQEIDQIKEEKDGVDQAYAEKIKELQALQEDRNEKNLSLSKLNLEKRTLQRQYDHMRETNRTLNNKLQTIQKELDVLRSKPPRERLISQSSINAERLQEDEDVTTTANSLSVDTSTVNDETGEENSSISPLSTIPLTQRSMSVRRESSTVRELAELLEKVKVLETRNNELDTQNKELEEELKDSTNACIKISERYDAETETTKRLEETCETYEKEINELKVNTSAQYSDLVVEYDNVRNYNQQLQNTIEKIRTEKDSIKNELNNYKSDVIEKIKENLDALEKERISLLSEKETLQLTVKSKEESENELKAKCSKLLQQVDETNMKSKTTSEAEDLLQRKHEALQKDYDRLLQKCRQLEQSASESAGLDDELKRLKEANEVLLQRYRSLEVDYDATLKASEEEKLKYNTLLTKHEKKCEQYDIGCNQYDTLEAEHKEACHNYDELVRENNKLCQQYDDLHRQHKQNCNKYEGMIKENKNLVERVSKCKCNEQNTTTTKSHETIVKNLQNEKANILSEKHELLDKKADLEKMIIALNEEMNELKSCSEVSVSDLHRAEEERDAYQTKYNHVCSDYDKITKEKAHFALTVETLRDENKRLNDALRKQRLLTSSSQDLTLQKLQDENETFHQQMDVLQTNLANAINENKRLLERINRSDENVAATIRGLKARKNELQLQVETLKHENEHLKKMPKTKEKRGLKFGKHSAADKAGAEVVVNESLRSAHARMAELQLENEEMRRKLQEYEGLLNEQHQALAHANDLAMQKNLEGSKMKRSLEKRMEKITKENNELRRIIFLLDDSNVNNNDNNNLSTTTAKTNSPPNTTSVEKPKKSSEHSVVNITFSTEGDTNTSTTSDNATDKTPQLISVSAVTNPQPSSNEQYSRTSSVPESPRLATSRSLENELSVQLKELMDVSNNITHHEDQEDLERSHSVESVAPPVPPPPPNYGTTTRRYNFRMPFLRLKRKSDVSAPVKKHADDAMSEPESRDVKNHDKGT